MDKTKVAASVSMALGLLGTYDPLALAQIMPDDVLNISGGSVSAATQADTVTRTSKATSTERITLSSDGSVHTLLGSDNTTSDTGNITTANFLATPVTTQDMTATTRDNEINIFGGAGGASGPAGAGGLGAAGGNGGAGGPGGFALGVGNGGVGVAAGTGIGVARN
jgi:hypothetical protein